MSVTASSDEPQPLPAVVPPSISKPSPTAQPHDPPPTLSGPPLVPQPSTTSLPHDPQRREVAVASTPQPSASTCQMIHNWQKMLLLLLNNLQLPPPCPMIHAQLTEVAVASTTFSCLPAPWSTTDKSCCCFYSTTFSCLPAPWSTTDRSCCWFT